MSLCVILTRQSRRVLSAGALLLPLMACGGGGGSDPLQSVERPGPTALGDDLPQTISGLRGGAEAIIDQWVPNGVPAYTTLSNVPSSGTATYDGFVYGDLSNDAVANSLIGFLTLEIGFAGDLSFAGTATDFVDQADAPFDGTLDVSGGTFNRDGNPASDATVRGVGLSGTLVDQEDVAWTVGIQLEGDFLGVTAQAIGGEAIGRLTSGATVSDFDGGFIADDE